MFTRIHPITNTDTFDSAYSALAVARDGNVYFGLCTHMPGKSAGLFRYSPIESGIEQVLSVADMTPKGYEHGKIHTPIVESSEGILYFATHFAYPYGLPRPVSYEGGRLFAYHPSTNKAEDLGIVQPGNGVIACAIDTSDNLIYLLTIPDGKLYRYTIATRQYNKLGTIPSNGSIARSIVVDKQGNVFGTYEKNGVFVYRKNTQELELRPSVLELAHGKEWNSVSRGGVNKLSRYMWRYVSYDEGDNAIYGIHSSGAAAFRLDCESLDFQVLGTFASEEELQRINSKIYPTLSLTGNGTALYYATSTGLFDYCRSENIAGWSHLLQFDKTAAQMKDMAIISDKSARRVYGAAAAASTSKHVYFLGAVERKESEPYNPFNIINQQPFQLGLIEVLL